MVLVQHMQLVSTPTHCDCGRTSTRYIYIYIHVYIHMFIYLYACIYLFILMYYIFFTIHSPMLEGGEARCCKGKAPDESERRGALIAEAELKNKAVALAT